MPGCKPNIARFAEQNADFSRSATVVDEWKDAEMRGAVRDEAAPSVAAADQFVRSFFALVTNARAALIFFDRDAILEEKALNAVEERLLVLVGMKALANGLDRFPRNGSRANRAFDWPLPRRRRDSCRWNVSRSSLLPLRGIYRVHSRAPSFQRETNKRSSTAFSAFSSRIASRIEKDKEPLAHS